MLVGVLHLPKPIRSLPALLPAGLRLHLGRRATAVVLALVLEALLVMALLTLGRRAPTPRFADEQLSAFNVGPPAQKADADDAKPRESKAQPQQTTKAQPKEEVKPRTEPPPLPLLIPMSMQDLAVADISRLPQRPARVAAAPQVSGPVDTASGDTPLMGTGPNGEPLYAAQWYRKPYDNELSGYLSTADGPGWGLIACKTEPDYRVDQCVVVDEYPQGSRIAPAVLAAAWQFRVRPPRRGGRSLIGEWVGIRIDYEQRRR